LATHGWSKTQLENKLFLASCTQRMLSERYYNKTTNNYQIPWYYESNISYKGSTSTISTLLKSNTRQYYMFNENLAKDFKE
jgi:hypothetical protein